MTREWRSAGWSSTMAMYVATKAWTIKSQTSEDDSGSWVCCNSSSTLGVTS